MQFNCVVFLLRIPIHILLVIQRMNRPISQPSLVLNARFYGHLPASWMLTPLSFRSLVTSSLSQVCLGTPTGLLCACWKASKDCLVGVYSGRRSTCPRKRRHLALILALDGCSFVLSYRSVLLVCVADDVQTVNVEDPPQWCAKRVWYLHLSINNFLYLLYLETDL